MNFWELGALFLTLVVLLYFVIGDNPLFRIVTYTFIGVASGYVFILVLFQTLLPRLVSLLTSGNIIFLAIGIVPFLLGGLLFFKLFPRASAIGTLPMAILVGIGAAVAIGGAVFGTVFGQIDGTLALVPSLGELLAPPPADAASPAARLLQGVFTIIGVITTLAYFHFSMRSRAAAAPEAEEAVPARRGFSLELLAKVGQVFIGITLGAVFAGVYSAAITALVERIGFIFDAATNLMAQL
jgi:hypothetical protein